MGRLTPFPLSLKFSRRSKTDVEFDYLPYMNQPAITPTIVKVPTILPAHIGKLCMLKPYRIQITPAMRIYM